MNDIRHVAIAALLSLVLIHTPLISPVMAGVSVSIDPPLTLVEPGDTFTVFIYKDSLDIEFDGYETVVTYDPEIIEYLGASEESVMTAPCPNRWWLVTPDTGSIFISHALLCGGLTTWGPGALSSLEFQAAAEGSTLISADYFWFTLGGIWNKDVDWHDGFVRVGYQTGIGRAYEDGDAGLSLTVSPNPARGGDILIQCSKRADGVTALAQLEIFDVRGRSVARLRPAVAGGTGSTYIWDGTGMDGSRLAGGVYFAGIAGPGPAVFKRIVLLR
jgi:hypothetical protein